MATEKQTQVPQVHAEMDDRQVISSAQDIIDTAITEAKAGAEMAETKPLESNVADSFKGLPMRELIANPLLAAAEAQQQLASVAWDYYQKIAYEDKDGTKTRMLKFSINRPVEQNGKMELLSQTIEAPFIGLVPIPSLLIDRVDVDFQMEVTDTNVNKTSSAAEASSKISGGWWMVKAEISGKVSSSRENTRTTNQTAKYQVHVTATQQPQTEGLSKLMDIMASCIEPLSTPS